MTTHVRVVNYFRKKTKSLQGQEGDSKRTFLYTSFANSTKAASLKLIFL